LRFAPTSRIIYPMGMPRRERIQEDQLHGFKHFNPDISPVRG